VINLKYYSIGEFAKLIGKTEQALRNWDKNNTLILAVDCKTKEQIRQRK